MLDKKDLRDLQKWSYEKTARLLNGNCLFQACCIRSLQEDLHAQKCDYGLQGKGVLRIGNDQEGSNSLYVGIGT